VKIYDTANTHLQTFNTTSNQLTLSRFNISTNNTECDEYLWSVAAKVNGIISQHIKGNNSFVLKGG